MESVYNAVAPLLLAGIPGLVTVADANQLDSTLAPVNLCPAVLLRARPQTENPLATGAANSVWWLDCTLWVYYQPVQTDPLGDPTLVDFRRKVQQLEAALRSNLAAGGSADDASAGTQVLVSGREMGKADLPVLSPGLGLILRRARRSSLIREVVYLNGV